MNRNCILEKMSWKTWKRWLYDMQCFFKCKCWVSSVTTKCRKIQASISHLTNKNFVIILGYMWWTIIAPLYHERIRSICMQYILMYSHNNSTLFRNNLVNNFLSLFTLGVSRLLHILIMEWFIKNPLTTQDWIYGNWFLLILHDYATRTTLIL